ncbi:MAG: VOC family protein [Alphaproteobacteria bacterium]|nr:VOC family protein [Alphaproteobacteria bacterium]
MPRAAARDLNPDQPIVGLHHNAYRCRDSEETRKFYEDFLGLQLADAFEIKETKTGRGTSVLHSFYEMGDGSYLAFFEDPATPFDFKDQRDYDLHISLEVAPEDLRPLMERGKQAGVETRGVADHGFIESIYFRDPNGYVIELSAETEIASDYKVTAKARAHGRLAEWQKSKPG